jgi:hypothetical protein
MNSEQIDDLAAMIQVAYRSELGKVSSVSNPARAIPTSIIPTRPDPVRGGTLLSLVNRVGFWSGYWSMAAGQEMRKVLEEPLRNMPLRLGPTINWAAKTTALWRLKWGVEDATAEWY